MFKRNLNSTGRWIRFSMASLLLIYAIWAPSWIALAMSIFTFFESYMSWCILYQFLGINHCPIDNKKK